MQRRLAGARAAHPDQPDLTRPTSAVVFDSPAAAGSGTGFAVLDNAFVYHDCMVPAASVVPGCLKARCRSKASWPG